MSATPEQAPEEFIAICERITAGGMIDTLSIRLLEVTAEHTRAEVTLRRGLEPVPGMGTFHGSVLMVPRVR